MSTPSALPDFQPEDLLADTIMRLIGDVHHVAAADQRHDGVGEELFGLEIRQREELLADTIMRLIGDVHHVAVGNASPIPALAALTLREHGGGKPNVSL